MRRYLWPVCCLLGVAGVVFADGDTDQVTFKVEPNLPPIQAAAVHPTPQTPIPPPPSGPVSAPGSPAPTQRDVDASSPKERLTEENAALRLELKKYKDAVKVPLVVEVSPTSILLTLNGHKQLIPWDGTFQRIHVSVDPDGQSQTHPTPQSP